MKKVRSELVKERQPPKHAAKNPRCKRVPRQVTYFSRRPFSDFASKVKNRTLCNAKSAAPRGELLLFVDQGVVDGASSGGAGLIYGGDFAVRGDFYLCNEDGFAGLLKSGFGGTGSGLRSGYVVPQEHPGRKKRAPDRSDTLA
jgi:hypothetical protein